MRVNQYVAGRGRACWRSADLDRQNATIRKRALHVERKSDPVIGARRCGKCLSRSTGKSTNVQATRSDHRITGLDVGRMASGRIGAEHIDDQEGSREEDHEDRAEAVLALAYPESERDRGR